MAKPADEQRSFSSGVVDFEEGVASELVVVAFDAEDATIFAHKLLEDAKWLAARPGGGTVAIHLFKGEDKESTGTLHVVSTVHFPETTKAERKAAAGKTGYSEPAPAKARK